VSLYLVHFKWKEKEVELMAKSLDLTHPYFVSIKGLVFPTEPKLVINPLEEEVRKAFGRADHLMIPFQTVSLIEELPENAEGRVVPFELIERPQKNPAPEKNHAGEEALPGPVEKQTKGE
jgi:hypothetical protein